MANKLIGYARVSTKGQDTDRRMDRPTINMLGLSEELAGERGNLRVLTLGGGNVGTGTPMGGMVFTVMAAMAQMELEVKREWINDRVRQRRHEVDARREWGQETGRTRVPAIGDRSPRWNQCRRRWRRDRCGGIWPVC